MSIRVLIQDSPQRTIALSTSTHTLTFRDTSSGDRSANSSRSASQVSLVGLNGPTSPQCVVEFARSGDVDLEGYRPLGGHNVHGTLGLITLRGDVFLCVVNAATPAATLRPGETVQKIESVEFHCLSSSMYDRLMSEVNPYPTDNLDEDGYDLGHPQQETQIEHPCLALKKLLSGGTFYYSADFDLTRRLQKRVADNEPTVAIDSLDAGFLWNSYMIQPLVNFRSRLSKREKAELDSSKLLTSAIRGFCLTLPVPWSSARLAAGTAGEVSSMTVVSRLSCLRAGTRFNSRGIDDNGNVANFVETETIFWSPTGLCFSYIQIRGSLPIFWEQATGLLPNQQKISITRSVEATQPSFDKHFEKLEHSYGAIHVVNLLSNEKSQELQLSQRYHHHIHQSPLNSRGETEPEHQLLRDTPYDFHAETRDGYEAASGIRYLIQESTEAFAYFLSEDMSGGPEGSRTVPILQQEGIFRTNCLDCLDRTNLVQTIISKLALESFFNIRGESPSPDFWARHRTLWADNGDTLSRIYAGTGALKSSFTRHGKMSLGGILSDARKTATRAYINNFADKARQNTIDLLLGRLMDQTPVHLYDPINEYVQAELKRREPDFTSTKTIRMLVATFNLNGRSTYDEDLRPWLCPPVNSALRNPEIVAVGFQEIVELSPQQIMSTDPARRQAWEQAVKRTLNDAAAENAEEEYIMLRGGQLVGASLSIFVRVSAIPYIRNVEGSLKKTGLSGSAGNKGAVAIRMDYADSSLCFVTAHLAAGHSNYGERNRDYHTIQDGLRFQRNRSIDDHDSVIWLGDFNYRINLGFEEAKQLAYDEDIQELLNHDQLRRQIGARTAFYGYTEAPIRFRPTYKFDNGTDEYDTSEKARVPAYTDRILSKGSKLKQINYDSAPLRFSDHRPVYATFECVINVVDERFRDQLSDQLYRKRKVAVGGSNSKKSLLDVGIDDDLTGYHQVERGGPTIDNQGGYVEKPPLRSMLHPKAAGQRSQSTAISHRARPTEEVDWVKVDKAPPPPPRRGTGASTHAPLSHVPRKVPPPLVPPPRRAAAKKDPPDLPQRPNPVPQNLLTPPNRASSPSSIRSMPITPSEFTVKRKPPPRPSKPTALSRTPTSAGTASPLSYRVAEGPLSASPPLEDPKPTTPPIIAPKPFPALSKSPLPIHTKPAIAPKPPVSSSVSSSPVPGAVRLPSMAPSIPPNGTSPNPGIGASPPRPPQRSSTASVNTEHPTSISKTATLAAMSAPTAPEPHPSIVTGSDRIPIVRKLKPAPPAPRKMGVGERMESEPPRLPPRRMATGGNAGLMDMRDESVEEALSGWEVLRST